MAILLLTVYLFNLAGYPLLFKILGQQSLQQLEADIDNKIYADRDLVEIKVALPNIPYLSSSNTYERVEGEINIAGSHYSYVKRKISGDTLYMMCLPNIEKDKLQVAKREYGKTANDFDGPQKGEKSQKKDASFAQYQLQHADYTLTPPQVCSEKVNSFVSLIIPVTYLGTPYLPPKLIS